jgi:creatinine amidohydrolase
MGAVDLYTLSWPDVRHEIERGRDTIVLPFGAVEQHGHHLPLGTDSILGDELGRALADRLDAFFAPTVRVGCSRHHLTFPGTMSLEEETFQRAVSDIVLGWAGHGFADNGVVGDPRRASAENGRRYSERLVELAVELVERES